MKYYRIVEHRPGFYIVKSNVGLFNRWIVPPEFRISRTGPGGKRFWTPIEFSDAGDARRAVQRVEQQDREVVNYPRIVEEAYVANNGQWCPVRDD